jgi:hypothetical protein
MDVQFRREIQLRHVADCVSIMYGGESYMVTLSELQPRLQPWRYWSVVHGRRCPGTASHSLPVAGAR